MTQESDVQNQIRLALSKKGIVFRTNAGDFWQGERIYSKEFHQEVLINIRRVTGLPEGFSDLLFIGDGEVAFIEVKKKGAAVRKRQKQFIETMRNLHHRAGIARSVEEALQIIEEE